MYVVIGDNRPMTVRQVFYQMVTKGYIEKATYDKKPESSFSAGGAPLIAL